MKFSADAESEIKFAHICVSDYFTAQLFHSAQQNLTCPQGQISLKKQHVKESEKSVCGEISAFADVKLWQKP